MLDSNYKFISLDSYEKAVNVIETKDDLYLVWDGEILKKLNKQGKVLWEKDLEWISYLGSKLTDLKNNEYIAYNSDGSRILKIKENKENLATDDLNIKNDQVVLYPNPVDNHLFVKIPNNQKVKKISLIDITGKVFFEDNKYQDKIDMSMYEPGIYLLKIESDSKVYIQKILKK